MTKTDLFVEVGNQMSMLHNSCINKILIVPPLKYLENFTWEQMKYNSGRPLVEIAGLITDHMKKIDNDIKKQQDLLTELRNQHAAVVKKEGNNFMTQDISEAIYSFEKLKPEEVFIEKATKSG